MTKKSPIAEIKALSASSAGEASNPMTQVLTDDPTDSLKTQATEVIDIVLESAEDASEASEIQPDQATAESGSSHEESYTTNSFSGERKPLPFKDSDAEFLPAMPARQIDAIIPEIEGYEGDLVGEAVRKEFVPGKTYFEYRNLLNKRTAKATNPDERRSAIYETQTWLMRQCYEVVEPSGHVRPLGLDDIECMDAETLAFTVADLVSIDVTVNFLDEKNDLEFSNLFEIKAKAQRFKVKKLSVERAIEIQEMSREDPSGIRLSQWLICNRIELNNEKIKLEDFDNKLDIESTVLLVQKADFLLKPYLQKKRSFTLRDTRGVRSQK